ncbi:MAG: cupin domain-containing protein [Xanthomonadales bacterium]|nr:cupin domain-containing protein [Xanthomonadales bacterium]
MEIYRSGARAARQGPEDHFTGRVWLEPQIETPEPARVRALRVTFEPGARTAWHTHPLGQTLLVQSGLGLIQVWGGEIAEIRPGDTVWFAPGEKHWHGAAPDSPMCHLAVQEALDGATVDWLEHVTDDQYRARRPDG